MGVLKYKYTCKDCGKETASYFNTRPNCPHCGSGRIVCVDITNLGIDKFSDEGRKLTEIEKEKRHVSED
jgi:DNA-directed RNA polymerase subunit RPC12/RpoP